MPARVHDSLLLLLPPPPLLLPPLLLPLLLLLLLSPLQVNQWVVVPQNPQK